jgi:WD40 repeat protein
MLTVNLNTNSVTDRIVKMHREDINTCDFKDSNVFATGSDDCLVKLWDIRLCPKNKCIGVRYLFLTLGIHWP